jgi:hypothetical protein
MPHALVFIIALCWIREQPLHLSPHICLMSLGTFLQSSYVIGTFSLTIHEHWLLKVLMMTVGSKGYPFGPILCIKCTSFLLIWCLMCWPLFKSDFFLLPVVVVEEVPKEGPGASSSAPSPPSSGYSKRRGTSDICQGQELALVIYLREAPEHCVN